MQPILHRETNRTTAHRGPAELPVGDVRYARLCRGGIRIITDILATDTPPLPFTHCA